MGSIQHKLEDENLIQSSVANFMKEHSIREHLASSGIRKFRGFSVPNIFTLLISLVFSGRNWFQFQKSSLRSHREIKKDTVYRFLNSAKFHWERFLFSVSHTVVSKLSLLTSDNREKVLIVDDTFYDRSRSKQVELLSRVHDHTDNKFKKGFNLLTLGWSDGFSFIPIAFRLLTAKAKDKILCASEYKGSAEDAGTLRRKDAEKKKPDLLCELVAEAQRKCFDFKYLLFDSWFALPSLIARLYEMNVPIIAMLKRMPKVKYFFRKDTCNLVELYEKIKKRWKKSSNHFEILAQLKQADSGGKCIDVKIVFVRNRNKKSDWIALISTDTSLSAEEIIRIYGKRWEIEVFFKMNKTYLKLAKEFQGRSFDQLASHTTIVFLRYIMLTVFRRSSQDEKTFGELFYEHGDEIKDITFMEALSMLLKQIGKIIRELGGLSKGLVEEILSQVIQALPPFFRVRLRTGNCES
jgi:hypothetical protein